MMMTNNGVGEGGSDDASDDDDNDNDDGDDDGDDLIHISYVYSTLYVEAERSTLVKPNWFLDNAAVVCAIGECNHALNPH